MLCPDPLQVAALVLAPFQVAAVVLALLQVAALVLALLQVAALALALLQVAALVLAPHLAFHASLWVFWAHISRLLLLLSGVIQGGLRQKLFLLDPQPYLLDDGEGLGPVSNVNIAGGPWWRSCWRSIPRGL